MSGITHYILGLRGAAALALVFGVPALESSAFFGFIFPGETAAILAGVLAYEGRVALVWAMVAVVAGAIVGDTVGYAVGWRWGARLLEGPLSRWIKPSHAERARQVMARRGGWAVFVGRFTAALRVLMPGIAGTTQMPYRRFLVFNAVGGVCWGVAYVLVGYAAGASWRQVAHTAGTVGLIAVVVVALAAIVILLMRRRRSTGAADPAAPPEAGR